MKFLKTLNPENASEEEVESYEVRTAARGVVFDNDGRVAILNVSKHNYYKLPGGGVEEGEDVIGALKRECQEELGCSIEIYGEVGEMIEYRKMFKLKQISPCYLAKVIGEKGSPEFTEEEIADEFEIKWILPKDAMKLFDALETKNDEGKLYIVPRDSAFLMEAIQLNKL
ncbi:MAG: NUDIX domain-containing protein [Candidatus Gracilibacteria bacterium]|jgi:8-oxo-dGTP pyrophosphatase MutT (NUDIX family)